MWLPLLEPSSGEFADFHGVLYQPVGVPESKMVITGTHGGLEFFRCSYLPVETGYVTFRTSWEVSYLSLLGMFALERLSGFTLSAE